MDPDSEEISFTIYKGSPSQRIVKGVTHRGPLTRDQVLIRITHSSLCATDEHYLAVDMCLGHEGAGVVDRIGPDVKGLHM